MAVDFGFKRIGIAVGESPLAIGLRPMLEAKGALKRDAEGIDQIARKEHAEAIVLGVPLSHDDERQARICRTLGEHLRNLGWLVHEVDESLTSVEAASRLQDFDLTAAQRKKTLDSRAAAIILERFFDEES